MKRELAYFILIIYLLCQVYSCSLLNHTKKSDSLNCIYLSQLEQRWNNDYIIEQTFTNGKAENYNIINPEGYFRLNNNGIYSVLSDETPLNGVWKIRSGDCNLVLDINTKNQRAFKILKCDPDSLVIRRSDTISVNHVIVYTQHYSKK